MRSVCGLISLRTKDIDGCGGKGREVYAQGGS